MAEVANSDFVHSCWGPARAEGLRSLSAHLWAPEKAGVRTPFLMLSPVPRAPENGGVA